MDATLSTPRAAMSARALIEYRATAWKDARNSILPALAIALHRHCPHQWVKLPDIFTEGFLPDGMQYNIFNQCIFKGWDAQKKGIMLYSFDDNTGRVLLRWRFHNTYYLRAWRKDRAAVDDTVYIDIASREIPESDSKTSSSKLEEVRKALSPLTKV